MIKRPNTYGAFINILRSPRARDWYATPEGGAAQRAAGDEGAMIAYAAFKVLEPTFIPTPATPNPLTIHEAYNAPDANEWIVAMDD